MHRWEQFFRRSEFKLPPLRELYFDCYGNECNVTQACVDHLRRHDCCLQTSFLRFLRILEMIGIPYWLWNVYGLTSLLQYSSGQNKVPTAEWKSRLIVIL